MSMKKRTSSRKRSLGLVGCCCFSPTVLQLLCNTTIITTASRQHVVRSAQRFVQYSDDNYPIRNNDKVTNIMIGQHHTNTYQSSSSSIHHEGYDETETTTAFGSIWHIGADAGSSDDDVDKLFESLRRHYGRSKKINENEGYLSSWSYTDSGKDTSSTGVFQHGYMAIASTTLHSLFGSRSRRVLASSQDEASVVDKVGPLDENFVKDSESTPIANVTDRPEISTSGFNITTGTEYNVTNLVDDNVTLASQSSPLTTAAKISSANDSSTVIFTKIQGVNTSTNVSGFVEGNATGADEVGGINTTISHNVNKTSSKIGFQPIRIRAFLSDIAGGGEWLNSTQRQLLLQQMIRPALLAWSSALRVRPVKGNLTVDGTQLHNEGKSCGPHNDELPSVAVPSSHLTEGVENTDVIVYIGLSFTIVDEDVSDAGTVSNNPFFTSKSNGTADESSKTNSTFVNKEKILKEQKKKNQTIRPKQKCAGDYMAASTFCSTDQYDRPTAVLLHICIDESFFDPANLAANIRAIMHEMGHALGFNSVSLAHFRRPDGTPITERNSDGTIPLSLVECTGPVGTINATKRRIPLPSKEILKFRTVRNGIRVAEVVTPSVVQVVRNHFDCQELTGAELESGEVLPLSTNPGEVTCLGDHWERRLFQSDLMNPYVEVETSDFDPRLSTLTLAFFADSGWYQADLSRAKYPSAWGRGAGCDFVEQPCVSANGTVAHNYDAYFCTNKPMDSEAMESDYATSIQGCTPDLARKASCSLGRHDGDLPPEYQYFKAKYGAEFGGNDPFMDYCPVFSGFANGLCSDSQNEAIIRVSKVERFGSRNSRCLASNVKSQATTLSTSGESDTSAPSTEMFTGLCMPIACVVEDRSLRIQVNGKWQTCTQKDEQLVSFSEGEVVTVTCPDPIRICPTFYCQRDCLGRSDQRSICDYNAGECVCDGAEVNSTDGTLSCASLDPQVAFDALLNETNPGNVSRHVDDETKSKPGIFYDVNYVNGQLPDPDSPLADYYVSTARVLHEENDSVFYEPWFWSVIAFASIVSIITLFLCYFWFGKPIGIADSVDAVINTGGDDDQGDNDAVIIPDKHKMLANIVVNMRMNDHSLQRRVDAMGDTASLTDLSMTDTEGTGCHINDVSVDFSMTTNEDNEYHETDSTTNSISVDVELHVPSVLDDSDFGLDPLAQPSQVQPVVRRRHMPFNTKNRIV